MPLIISGLIAMGLLCLWNLLLMIGVLKRLRSQDDLLASMKNPAQNIRPGLEIGDFQADTVDGDPISRAELTGNTVVAFFAPSCGPCADKVPEFVRYAAAMPGGRERVLAVVVAEPGEADEFVTQLRHAARVVVEPPDGDLGRAFQTSAFPTILRVAPDAQGRVVVRDNHVDTARVPAAVG